MNKKQASISIMAVLVFAIVAFVSLYLFSRVESQTLYSQAQKDSIQSGYLAESFAYLAWNEYIKKDINGLYNNRERRFPSLEFNGTATEEILLRKEREEGDFSTLSLETKVTYLGIPSKAILKGRLINPIFYQDDGILSPEEHGYEEIVKPWISSLEKDITYSKDPLDDAWLSLDGDSIIYENNRYHIVRNQEKQHSFSAMNPVRGHIHGTVIINGPFTMKGLLLIDDGSVIKGNVRVDGVCILGRGSKIEGSLHCDGLLIGSTVEGVRAAFNPRSVERVLWFFPGFIEPRDLHMKKLYIE